MSEVKIMLGNEAIARGAFEAGVKVSAAYPGTPSTEISENIVKYPEIYAPSHSQHRSRSSSTITTRTLQNSTNAPTSRSSRPPAGRKR